jgi:hypothetical protein
MEALRIAILGAVVTYVSKVIAGQLHRWRRPSLRPPATAWEGATEHRRALACALLRCAG